MTEQTNPLLLDTATTQEIAPGVTLIPDAKFTPLVPNAAVIAGDDAVLVFETGMGPANGDRMLSLARQIAGERDIFLTLSHFHPEHAYGAQAFKGAARIVYNESQARELARKGQSYVDLFRTFGPDVEQLLEGVELVEADETYSGSHQLDLGGRIVELIEIGQAHTSGDQLVWLPKERIVFTGDLLETGVFPIFPFFPPDDQDVDVNLWLDALGRVRGLVPATIVPGHGALGGTELIDAAETYLRTLGTRVAVFLDQGTDADEIVEQLTPATIAEHPEWREPNWVELTIRSIIATGFHR